MAVKSKSKAKTTEFEKLVASYAERVNNGELTPLKAVQYREFGDDKGYFIVVDAECLSHWNPIRATLPVPFSTFIRCI